MPLSASGGQRLPRRRPNARLPVTHVSQNRAHSPPRALALARPAPGGHRRMDRMVATAGGFIVPWATYPPPPMRSSTSRARHHRGPMNPTSSERSLAFCSRSYESKPPSLQNLGRFKDTRKQPPCRPRSLGPAASSSDRARRSSTASGRPQTPSPPSPSRHCPAMPQKQVPKAGTAPRGLPGGRSGPAPEYGSNPLSDNKEVSGAKLKFFVRISGVQRPLPVRTSLKPGGTSLNHNEKPLSVRTSLKESGLERDCSSGGSSATSSLADSQTTPDLPAQSSDSIPAHGWLP